MKQFGLAIVGCGVIAKSHLAAIVNMPDVKLVATVDSHVERAEAYAKEYGATRHYGDYGQALADPEVDGVILCLPPFLHAPFSIQGAQAGKHVLVEKPIAASTTEGREMIAAAAKSGTVLMVGQIMRFWNSTSKVRELIQSGAIGRPVNLIRRRAMWHKDWPAADGWHTDPKRAAGWVLTGFGAHEVDTPLFVLNDKPVRVFAEGRKNNPHWNDYDEITIQYSTTGGCMCTTIISCNTQQPVGDTMVVGTEGSLTFYSDRILLGKEEISVPMQKYNGFEQQTREFVRAAQEGREPISSGAQVLPTAQVLEAAAVSMEQHQAITINK